MVFEIRAEIANKAILHPPSSPRAFEFEMISLRTHTVENMSARMHESEMQLQYCTS
jgi:hypothetical protein